MMQTICNVNLKNVGNYEIKKSTKIECQLWVFVFPNLGIRVYFVCFLVELDVSFSCDNQITCHMILFDILIRLKKSLNSTEIIRNYQLPYLIKMQTTCNDIET